MSGSVTDAEDRKINRLKKDYAWIFLQCFKLVDSNQLIEKENIGVDKINCASIQLLKFIRFRLSRRKRQNIKILFRRKPSIVRNNI